MEAPSKLPDLNEKWPADKVERRNVASLVPAAKNARTHSAEQINSIAASIKEWGWTTPVLLDEAGNIIAGHGRVLAAKKLGIETVPCVVAEGWSDAKKRAYALADNQLPQGAGWDPEILRSELGNLKALNFDLAPIGFSLAEIGEIMDPAPTSERRELTEAEKSVERAAWRMLATDWDAQVKSALERAFLTTNYSRGSLAVRFVRALHFGGDIERGAGASYQPHRVFVAGAKYPVSDLFETALSADNVLDSVIWRANGAISLEKFLFGGLAIHGHRAAPDFPASLARDLIEEFCPVGGAVLDPCHGWGGRLLGFLLSRRAKSYSGFDVDPLTSAGVKAMFDDLLPFAGTAKEATFTLCPFEDAMLAPASFDFALTSPPYFDVEKYGGDLSSWRRYSGGFEDWVAGFYAPLIEKTALALRPGAVLALQVGNQSYPLEKRAKAIARGAGLTYLETRPTAMRNNQAKTSDEDGEVVVIFQNDQSKQPSRRQ